MKIFIKDLNFITNWFYQSHTFEEIMSKWIPKCNTEYGVVYLLPILKCVHRGGRGFEKNTYTLAKEVAIVDKDWYEKLSVAPWGLHNDGYAAATTSTLEKAGFSCKASSKKLVLLHRVVLGVVEDKTLLVDHKNGDKLDNREYNLRLCNHSANMNNKRSHKGSSSKYRGVSWCKRDCKWQVFYRKDSKNVYIGLYDNEIDAALAYDAAVRTNIEDTSYNTFNFPEEGEQSAIRED